MATDVFLLAVSVSWYRHLLRPNRKRSKIRPGPPPSSSGGASSSRRNAKAWKSWKCWIPTWRHRGKSPEIPCFYGGSYGISRNCHDFMVVPWFIKIQKLMCWKHLPVGIWKMDHFLWGSKRFQKLIVETSAVFANVKNEIGSKNEPNNSLR